LRITRNVEKLLGAMVLLEAVSIGMRGSPDQWEERWNGGTVERGAENAMFLVATLLADWQGVGTQEIVEQEGSG